MANMVEVTKAGGDFLGKDHDEKVLINADNVNVIGPVSQDSVGTSKIVFNDGTSICVVETQAQLQKIMNT